MCLLFVVLFCYFKFFYCFLESAFLRAPPRKSRSRTGCRGPWGDGNLQQRGRKWATPTGAAPCRSRNGRCSRRRGQKADWQVSCNQQPPPLAGYLFITSPIDQQKYEYWWPLSFCFPYSLYLNFIFDQLQILGGLWVVVSNAKEERKCLKSHNRVY